MLNATLLSKIEFNKQQRSRLERKLIEFKMEKGEKTAAKSVNIFN
jgi:hypothetical protein